MTWCHQTNVSQDVPHYAFLNVISTQRHDSSNDYRFYDKRDQPMATSKRKYFGLFQTRSILLSNALVTCPNFLPFECKIIVTVTNNAWLVKNNFEVKFTYVYSNLMGLEMFFDIGQWGSIRFDP